MGFALLRRQIELLLFAACLLALLAGGAKLGGAPIPYKVTCVATNQIVILAQKNENGTSTEVASDDWRVVCKIMQGDKKIFEEALTIAHPTKFREAMDAIDVFRKERAPQIIKENSREKK
jgi:hypothetical protein